jgi:hypothetical protein
MLGSGVFKGASALLAGPLGVVKIGFKGYDLGKTTAETQLVPDQDIKDINYQQDGTKPADKVRTGIVYKLTTQFGEISTGLLRLLMAGLGSDAALPAEDFGVIGRSVYQSMRDTEAGALKIAACSADGVASEDDEDTLCFYEAIANINGALINWGADVQRNLPVEFTLFFHEFAVGESIALNGAVGYYGDPAESDVPAIVWPVVGAPQIVSANVPSATSLVVTFNKSVAEVDGATTETKISASVDGVFKTPSTAVVAGAVLTLTFAAATFAAGRVVKLSISAGVIEDTATTPNENAAVFGQAVTNALV